MTFSYLLLQFLQVEKLNVLLFREIVAEQVFSCFWMINLHITIRVVQSK